ncbi:MAG TPA: HIT domain-containing protein [Candidatus Limnocylindrales bacterium]|nr:HIT domain-containing protein [Candidatus Limnocylindrales bacterium]
MERLWAGWRMEYVAPEKRAGKGHSGRKRKAGCLFCQVAAKRPAGGNLVLATTPLALVMLNLYPYNVGHVIVAPRRHLASPEGLKPEEAVEMTSWLGRMIRALKREYRPHGFNLGVNLGRVAGAGIVGHLHWHIVPRWNGDTNFMPVLANTKVVPESLDRTYRRLRRALEGPGPRRRAR